MKVKPYRPPQALLVISGEVWTRLMTRREHACAHCWGKIWKHMEVYAPRVGDRRRRVHVSCALKMAREGVLS